MSRAGCRILEGPNTEQLLTLPPVGRARARAVPCRGARLSWLFASGSRSLEVAAARGVSGLSGEPVARLAGPAMQYLMARGRDGRHFWSSSRPRTPVWS